MAADELAPPVGSQTGPGPAEVLSQVVKGPGRRAARATDDTNSGWPYGGISAERAIHRGGEVKVTRNVSTYR